jgi:UDP-N-acetylglucosamine:LPS N-acetylglucosamine transferase
LKRIVYLSYYFEPDLSACSYRNSSLANELAIKAKSKNICIDLYTTSPNRYTTFNSDALEFEKKDNLQIHRILVPSPKNGVLGQILSFKKFYYEVKRLTKNKKVDLVFASSSKFFTAFLGYNIARKSKSQLYLDIRDIFIDTLDSIIKLKILKLLLLPFLKIIEKKTFNYASHINLISPGFKSYFQNYKNSTFSFYTNGVDEIFLSKSDTSKMESKPNKKKLIVYAGNIGEGQGLHKIIPQAAKQLEKDYEFLIVGDGGIKKLLEIELNKLKVNNVSLQDPIDRDLLIEVYNKSDYLFLHLNDYKAFRKVLPSKIFELATFNKSIIAGVSGYSAKFIKSEISHSFVFEPCNVNDLVEYLLNNVITVSIDRRDFINKFKRVKINKEMVSSILEYI